MDASTVDRALSSLEEALRMRGAQVRRLSPEEFEDSRKRWRAEFGPNVGRRSWSWSHEGYDWHVFSLQRHGALEGQVATQAFTHSTADTHRFVVLSAVDGAEGGLEVTAPKAVDLQALGEDWSLVAGDWSWSMSWTSAGEGPFFARP